jgi:hypothetical protein
MGCHDLLRAVIEGLTSPAIERMGSTPAGWNAVAETESSPKLNSRPDIVTLMTASAFAGVEMDASAGRDVYLAGPAAGGRPVLDCRCWPGSP